MKVRIRDEKQDQVIGEMNGGSEEMGYVCEMITDPAKLKDLVPVEGITERAASIAQAAKDDAPEFPVLRVEEGWSNSKRLWDANELDSIVRQTNELEPVGHLGHIPDDQAGTAFPDVQTTWLGAVTKTEPSKQKERVGEMVKVAYFAGYNHVGAKVRKLIPTRAVRGISWWGRAHEKPIPGRGVQIVGFELKAIDWARKLSEGMPTSSIVAIASEMEDDKMDKDLAQVTPDEFKKENPNAHALIVAEAQTEMKATVGEMEEKIEEGKKQKTLLDQVMAVLGIEDSSALVDEVTKLKTKVGEKANLMVKDALAKLLEEKVPNEEKRSLVTRLLPVGEMEAKAADAKDGEEVAKIVGEMTDEALNSDDILKGIVSEQAPPVVRRREELQRGGDKDNPYIEERQRVSVS